MTDGDSEKQRPFHALRILGLNKYVHTGYIYIYSCMTNLSEFLILFTLEHNLGVLYYSEEIEVYLRILFQITNYIAGRIICYIQSYVSYLRTLFVNTFWRTLRITKLYHIFNMASGQEDHVKLN